MEIWQDNVLTAARYEMSQAEKKVLNLVINQVRKGDPATKIYQVNVNEKSSLTDPPESTFETYKQATEKLMRRTFQTTLPNGKILQATFFSSAEYELETGVIEIELSQKVRPFYIDLNQRFTKNQLAAAIHLKSTYAKRMYELLCMNKNGSNNIFRCDLVELKTKLGIIDQKTGRDSYSNWTRFQKNILDVAAKEINGHTDLSFRFKPIYGDRPGRGRKPVHEVEFEILQPTKPEPESASNSVLHERLTSQFGLLTNQADRVISKHSIEIINRHLDDIQTKVDSGTVKHIRNYTATVLGISVDEQEK